MTVRDSAGTVIQFLYGEDGLDPTMASLLGKSNTQPTRTLLYSRFVYRCLIVFESASFSVLLCVRVCLYLFNTYLFVLILNLSSFSSFSSYSPSPSPSPPHSLCTSVSMCVFKHIRSINQSIN